MRVARNAVQRRKHVHTTPISTNRLFEECAALRHGADAVFSENPARQTVSPVAPSSHTSMSSVEPETE